MIRRASVTRTVDPVHTVAGLNEVMHPAGASADAHHVGALPASAVDHHHRIRVAWLGRDHVLDEHLAERDRSVRHRLALDADPETALIGEFERRRFPVGMGIGSWAGPRSTLWDGCFHPGD